MRGEFVLTISHCNGFPRPSLFSYRQFVFALFVFAMFRPSCPHLPGVIYLSTIIPDMNGFDSRTPAADAAGVLLI